MEVLLGGLTLCLLAAGGLGRLAAGHLEGGGEGGSGGLLALGHAGQQSLRLGEAGGATHAA